MPRWQAIAAALGLLVLGSGCSGMSGRYMKMGLPVVYENADTLIGWQADTYLDLTTEQRRWLDAQVQARQAWHRKTQLPRYAAAMETLGRTALERPLTTADVDSVEDQVRQWMDVASVQGLVVAGELFAQLSDAQLEHFRAELEKLNRKTTETAAELTEAERIEEARERMADSYEDFLGELTLVQLGAIERAAKTQQWDGVHRDAYWRRWQAELFALLARRKAAPDCFVAQFSRMAGERERWYTPEVRRIRAHNERLQRELRQTLLTSMTAEQRRHFATRTGEWANTLASLARKPVTGYAAATPPSEQVCRQTAGPNTAASQTPRSDS